MIGEILIDRYEILEKVGAGGMALVYSAKDHLLNRLVAVKILREQFAGDEEFVERFRREARSAASLSHPNIVNIYDVGQTGNVHFIVMEYVQGQSLGHLIKNKKDFSQNFIVNVGQQIAQGLAHAHYHGIIHRDIKPHNILITKEERVKVTDFGIAQAMSGTELTQTGMILGSVHYFSPEQARGINVGAASDLYSLGIVLYEMITGKQPFQGSSPISVALKQIQETPPPPSQYVSDLDRDLEELVLGLLAKNPAQRPSGAEEVITVFQRIERRMDLGSEGETGKKSTTLVRGARKKKGVFGVARPQKKKNVKHQKKEVPQTKVRPALIVLLLVVLILSGIGFALNRIIPKILFREDVLVPNIVGLLEEEGSAVLSSHNLILNVTQRVFDNEKPLGSIISQEPLAGRMVKENRQISVRISKGPEEIEMPSVLGLSAREARLNLTQTGFVLGGESEIYEPSAGPGTVLEQWPQPGGIVVKGTEVNLVISKDQETVVSIPLPDFRGRDFTEIKLLLAGLGLKVGNSWPEYSTVYQEGQVIEHNPVAGTEVQLGWTVDFVYSQGIPQIAAPPQTAKEPEQEKQWMEENLWQSREVVVDVPDGPPQEVVILVIDDFGAREVYRDTHKGGSQVISTVQGRGEGAKMQVYIGARQFLDRYFRD